jgi:hypothetical protein
MNSKQLVHMGHTFEHTACMEHHVLRLFSALSAALGFLIDDGDVVNAYAHTYTEGPMIYLIVNDVCQAWYLECFTKSPMIGSCTPRKATQKPAKGGEIFQQEMCDASLPGTCSRQTCHLSLR